MRMKRTKRPDPAGKPVDSCSPPAYLRTFVFEYSEEIKTKIVDLSVAAMVEIGESASKRVRERDFLIWTGEFTNQLDMRLYIVGVPYGLHSPVLDILYRKYSSEPSFVEINYSPPGEFKAQPILRYQYGRHVLYASPFIPAPQARLQAGLSSDFEARSFQQAPMIGKGPYSAPERPLHRSPLHHDEAVWLENRERLMEFMRSLKGPCGLRRLRSIVEECFGVSVFEEGSREFAHYGLIRLGSGATPKVRILVNKRLPEKLKYIVLAHELGHYLLHFPLLLILRYVEETAWSIPEIEPYCRQLLTDDPLVLQSVEDRADEIASFFLVPAWVHPVQRMTAVISEGGVSPPPSELIWRFLQPLFPEDRFAHTTWNDLAEIRKRARRDVNRLRSTTGDQTANLFERMLVAALRVDEAGAEGVTKERPEEEPLEPVLGAMHAVAIKVESLSAPEVRRDLRTLLKGTYPGPQPLSEGEFLPGLGTFGRELVSPLGGDGGGLLQRIPLEPTIYNPQGRADGDWRLRTSPGSPVGTLAEWRKWKPDHGVVLYRFESWQKKALEKL